MGWGLWTGAILPSGGAEASGLTGDSGAWWGRGLRRSSVALPLNPWISGAGRGASLAEAGGAHCAAGCSDGRQAPAGDKAPLQRPRVRKRPPAPGVHEAPLSVGCALALVRGIIRFCTRGNTEAGRSPCSRIPRDAPTASHDPTPTGCRVPGGCLRVSARGGWRVQGHLSGYLRCRVVHVTLGAQSDGSATQAPCPWGAQVCKRTITAQPRMRSLIRVVGGPGGCLSAGAEWDHRAAC